MKHFVSALFLVCVYSHTLIAQNDIAIEESKFYQIQDISIPEDIILEVGGLAFMPDDRLAISTRRGEIWILNNPYLSKGATPKFSKFASGLHEPLGLAYKNGSLYATQRAELTKVTDTDKDGQADLFKTIYSWPLSGNYHEYSYGPYFLPNGDMLVTLNLSWIGYGASLSKWRGWLLKITEDGEMTPLATGLRSPAGLGFDTEGEIFYSENQGDWIGSGRITHLEEGDFAGNPAGLKWTSELASPLKLKPSHIPDSVGSMYEFAKSVSSLKVPTVWFPHTILGISTSAILSDTTGGAFGPFDGQMLVGDQGHSKIMRVFLEKIDGVYQGAVFPFREGFSSGILRMAWGKEGSLFVGMTSRGWKSTGEDMYGLQKLSWNGATPFEIKTMKAKSDGFELEFTKAVDKESAIDPQSYAMTSFSYIYHRKYGSPVVQKEKCSISGISLSDDRKTVRLFVEGMREGFIHELKATGIRSASGSSLLHSDAYYTLNKFPESDDETPLIAFDNNQSTAIDNTIQCGWDESKRTIQQPVDWANGPDVLISIGTKPGLQFDIKDFEVPAGAKVQVTFNNNDDMLHNLVISKPGTVEDVSDMSMNMGLEGTQRGYIPDSDDILYHTCILEPEKSENIFFVAPNEGEYPYLCTFPGHSKVMRGVMKVVATNTASR